MSMYKSPGAGASDESTDIQIAGTQRPDFLDQHVVDSLSGLSGAELYDAIRHIVQQHGEADRLKFLIDALEIASTPSAFADPKNVEKLEHAMSIYNFGAWLKAQNIDTTAATREHMIAWWEVYMDMAGSYGYIPAGRIGSGEGALWKATANLAVKMDRDPRSYLYLPPGYINDGTQVDRVLSEVRDPRVFAEILTGQAWEDMASSKGFIEGFNVVESDDEDPERRAIWSIHNTINKRANSI